jgi:hypothetical protein
MLTVYTIVPIETIVTIATNATIAALGQFIGEFIQ